MQSRWYAIAEVVGAQLAPVAAAAGCTWLLNPALPLDLRQIEQQRVLFLLHRGDKLLDKPGQVREKRRLRLVVGAMALTTASLADADALLFAARRAMRGDAWRAALRATGDVGAVGEVELEAELKDVATEGSALMSAFEIDYFQTYDAA